MRVGAGSTCRQTDLLQEFTDRRARSLRSDVLVQQDRFGELGFDALHRVERVHRTLEHHSDLRPADRAQLAERHRHDVLAIEADLAGHLRRLRQQAQHRTRQCGFATAGFAGDADGLAQRHGQRHIAHRGDRALPGLVGDADVVELQKASYREPRAGRGRPRAFGR